MSGFLSAGSIPCALTAVTVQILLGSHFETLLRPWLSIRNVAILGARMCNASVLLVWTVGDCLSSPFYESEALRAPPVDVKPDIKPG